MKLIYSLLILSLIFVAGCKRPGRTDGDSTPDPAVTSMHDVETAPLQNSHLATAEFTPVEPEEPMDPEDSAEPTENISTREIIGSWSNKTSGSSSDITLYSKDNKIFLEEKWFDGSIGNHEMIETQNPKGRRFEKKGGVTAGDHFILTPDGNLQQMDDDGLISTAMKK